MNYFAGLGVSLEWTSVWVVDVDGGIVREAKVVSELAQRIADRIDDLMSGRLSESAQVPIRTT